MDKDLQLASLRDEWLISPIKSRSSADFEASGLLMGMKKLADSFTTNRLQAARRLTGPGKFPLWPLSSYAEIFPLTISMITRPNHKPSVKFTCPPAILKTPKSLRSSWQWLKGLWGSAGGLYFPKTGYYLTLIVSDADTAEILPHLPGLTFLHSPKGERQGVQFAALAAAAVVYCVFTAAACRISQKRFEKIDL